MTSKPLGKELLCLLRTDLYTNKGWSYSVLFIDACICYVFNSGIMLSSDMLNLTNRLCWKFVKKDGYIAIWQKPSDNSCYLNREAGTKPPLCDLSDVPDNVWYCVPSSLICI